MTKYRVEKYGDEQINTHQVTLNGSSRLDYKSSSTENEVVFPSRAERDVRATRRVCFHGKCLFSPPRRDQGRLAVEPGEQIEGLTDTGACALALARSHEGGRICVLGPLELP